MQDVEFKVDGQTLKGKLFYPNILKDKNPAIIFVHGWTSSFKGSISRAEALIKLGFICFIFDLRGHGESDGKIVDVTAEGSLKDCIAAYDYVASLPEVNKRLISVVGSSYGGYLSALLSEKRPISSLVLRVPAIYRDETFSKTKLHEARKLLAEYRKSKVDTQDNLVLKTMQKYTGKLLLIESEEDEQIPHQTIENYRNAIGKPEIFKDIVMKGADHSLSQEKWRKEYIDILVDWFGKI